MGQMDILQLLKKHPDNWFTADEISDHLCIGKASIHKSLNKLNREGLIERIDQNPNDHKFSSYIFRLKETG